MRSLTIAALALMLTASRALAGDVPTVVPEPASVALIAVGAGALALVRFRRK